MTQNGMPGPIRAQRFLELLAVLVIAVSASGFAATRLGIFHAPQVWICGFLLTFAYHHVTRSSPLSLTQDAPAWHLILVAAAGLLFRLTPYAYVLGGQDQGVYLNMAMELARSGGLNPVDPILPAISDSAVLDLYRSSNYQPNLFLPGIYAVDGGLEFQFYHLFPIWLALFGDGFGPEVAVYALTFFSLVSLLFFQRLAHLLTGSAKIGLVAGLLLAVNPLHAFFSKFPVTEVPTLAFSAMSFAFLVIYWRAPGAQGANRSLVLSLLALGMLFVTRISGFMYLPFILALSLASTLFDTDRVRRGGVLAWAVGVVALYAVSVLDGLERSSKYARDIYDASFAPLLGEHWKLPLLLVLGAAAVAWSLGWALSCRESTARVPRKFVLTGLAVLPVVGLLFAAIAIYKAYLLGYTDTYAADPWMGQRFHLSHGGLRSVFSVSLVASASYLSPFILLGVFLASFMTSGRPLLQALMLFVICFMGYIAILLWSLPYQPYYARYLLSEFVPYGLLLMVCVWGTIGKGRLRTLLGAGLLLGALYGAGLSAMQLGENEHDGVVDSVDRLVSGMDRSDLLLLDRSLSQPNVAELKTPLLFGYGLTAVTTTDADMASKAYLAGLSKPYDDVYFVSKHDIAPAGFVFVDSVRFTEWAFKHGTTPPIDTVLRGSSRWYIYRQRDDSAGIAARLRFSSGQNGAGVLGEGWSTPEGWGVWSKDNRALLTIGPGVLPREGLRNPVLRLTGRAYVSPKVPSQRIRLLVGGKQLLEVIATLPHPSIDVELPMTGIPADTAPLEIEIQMPDAVSPKSLGYSTDDRTLAFGLESIELREKTAPGTP